MCGNSSGLQPRRAIEFWPGGAANKSCCFNNRTYYAPWYSMCHGGLMNRQILHTLLLAVSLTSGLYAAETSGNDATSTNAMKKVFPIGVWFDGRVEGINCPDGYHNVPKDMKAAKEYYQRNFQDIHDHGIQVIVVPNTPPDYRETLLGVADSVGVQIVLEMVELAYPQWGGEHTVRNAKMVRDEAGVLKYCDAITSAARKHKSLFCYQVLDEPPAKLFDNFAAVNRALLQIDPAHPSFSCLCSEAELPRTTTMGTQMVVFDRYPLRKGSKPGDYDFGSFRSLLDNLDKYSGVLPYWMAVQAFGMDKPDGIRYPTEAELRVMTWLSLAHNCKGIFFFLHNSMSQEERLQGLVDLEMTPHPIYAEAADLSRTMKRLAPLLLRINRTADPLVKPQNGFDIQSFDDTQTSGTPGGSRYAFVVNLDVLHSAEFKGELADAKSAPAQLRDLIVDVPIDVTHEADAAKISLRLPPGGAALLKIAGNGAKTK